MIFDRKLIEAANRAEVSAILIRAGYRVFVPEADVDGVDLLLLDKNGIPLKTQQKARPTCHAKYYGKQLYMLFPAPTSTPLRRDWFLVLHDPLFDLAKAGYKPKKEFVARHWPKMSSDLKGFLASHAIRLPLPATPDSIEVEKELSI